MTGRDIIVMGGADLPAAVFVVVHFPPYSTSVLPRILTRAGALPAVHPSDGDPVEHGTIYVAPPDHHLLLEEGRPLPEVEPPVPGAGAAGGGLTPLPPGPPLPNCWERGEIAAIPRGASTTRNA